MLLQLPFTIRVGATLKPDSITLVSAWVSGIESNRYCLLSETAQNHQPKGTSGSWGYFLAVELAFATLETCHSIISHLQLICLNSYNTRIGYIYQRLHNGKFINFKKLKATSYTRSSQKKLCSSLQSSKSLKSKRDQIARLSLRPRIPIPTIPVSNNGKAPGTGTGLGLVPLEALNTMLSIRALPSSLSLKETLVRLFQAR